MSQDGQAGPMVDAPSVRRAGATVRRLDFVDALRGAAALYVVVMHMVLLPNPRLGVPWWAKRTIYNGGSGVTLFFVLSAFTLCYTLHSRRNEPQLTRRFYIRRIFRIVPLYYCWLVVMAFWMYGARWFMSLANVRWVGEAAVFAFNLLPGRQEGIVWASWTLGVEMLVYLLFPLIFFWVDSGRKAVAFLGLTYLICILNLMVTRHHMTTNGWLWLNYGMVTHLPSFAVGILTYFTFEALCRREGLGPRLGPVLLAVGAAGFFGVPFVVKGGMEIYPMAVVYSAIVLGLAFFPVRLLVNPFTVFVGTISYSTYLNHLFLVHNLIPVYHRIYATRGPDGLHLVECIVLTLAPLLGVSYLTYRFIEQPGIRWGSRLIKRGETRRVALAAVPQEVAAQS